MKGMLDALRHVRDKQISRQQYQSAVLISSKILAFNDSNSSDVFLMARCLYWLDEYIRAVHLITWRQLHEKNIECCVLVVKCYFRCKKYKEALALTEKALRRVGTGSYNITKWQVPLLVMQSLLYEAIDNRKAIKDSLYKALDINFACYEAFRILTSHHLISKAEELSLLNTIIKKNNKKEPFLCAFMKFFYYIQMKKYDKPDTLVLYPPFTIFGESYDYLTFLAERHFYNFEHSQALEITKNLLKRDLFNLDALLIHVSCLFEFQNKNELFELSQKLVSLYPEREISWYALGCYYHLIEKVDLSRRFLQKATTLNSVYAPAWILYGFSFSQEFEHDQAMATYFKASHLMPGCHLPSLYIGVEYIRTDNCKLGEKFIQKALNIAPDDPQVLHEKGIVAMNTNDIFIAEKYFSSALKVLKLHASNQNWIQSIPNRYDTLLNNLGHVLRKLVRYTEAIDYHRKALMLRPENPSSYTSIGLVYCMMSKWSEAVEALDYAFTLYKLLGRDDQHTNSLLEVALKNFYKNPTPQVNRFSDKDYIDKLCDQLPVKVYLDTNDASKIDESEPMILGDSQDVTMDESMKLETSSSFSLDTSLRLL